MVNILTFQEKFEAYCRNDSSYEGIFITAVKTTGIFCRTTCKARNPNIENVMFFETTQLWYSPLSRLNIYMRI